MRITSPRRSSFSLSNSRRSRSGSKSLILACTLAKSSRQLARLHVLGDQIFRHVAGQPLEHGLTGQRFHDDLLAQNFAGFAVELGQGEVRRRETWVVQFSGLRYTSFRVSQF